MSADDDVPESAMDTGSDEGEPGDRGPYEPLGASDRAILDALRRPAPASAGTAVEDRPEMAAAVRDDSPLTGDGEGGESSDGLSPLFREPS